MVTTTWYRCEFVFKGVSRAAWSRKGLDAFTSGFWLDSEYEYTEQSNNVFWVPPSAITYIQKERRR